MGTSLTWVAILASLFLGLAGVCLFIFAVKKDYFRDFEDVKYQVFWSDLDEDPNLIGKEMTEGGTTSDDTRAVRR